MTWNVPAHETVARVAVILALSPASLSKGSHEAQEQPTQTPIAVDLCEAITKKKVSVSLTIPGTHNDLFGPQDHPFDAQLTLKRESRSRNTIRIVIKPGTVIEGRGNSVVFIDETSLDLPPDHRSEKTIHIKAYRLWIPVRAYGMGIDYRRPKEGSKFLRYMCSLPDLHAADDPVRQAVVWMATDRSITYGTYAEVYNTVYTSGSGELVKRTDPFQITTAQWAKAQRIVNIVNSEQQRELDLENNERKRQFEKRQRLKAEAKARVVQANALRADRRARTRMVTLQQAIADGLVSVSVDALVPPPAKIELRIKPMPTLGTNILDLRVPAGTVLRETSGGKDAKTGYLSPGRVEIEYSDSVNLRLTCLLRSLDDAGPGDFVFDRPYPMAAIVMQDIRKNSRTAGISHRSDHLAFGNGESAQMTILLHGNKNRALQQWKKAFRRKGMDDLYDAIAAAFKEVDVNMSSRLIHRAVQNSVFLFERLAEDITAPDGSTYSEEYIIGTWHRAKARTAFKVKVEREAREREIMMIVAKQQETPDPADVEKALRGVFKRNIRAVRKSWKNTKEMPSIASEIKLSRRSTYVITLNPDHTYELVANKLTSEPETSEGDWIWNGRKVVLNPYDLLELYKGLMISNSQTSLRATILTKRSARRARHRSSPR